MEQEKVKITLELLKPENYSQFAESGPSSRRGETYVHIQTVEKVHYRYAVGVSKRVNLSYPESKTVEDLENFIPCEPIRGGFPHYIIDRFDITVEDGEQLYTDMGNSDVMYIVKPASDIDLVAKVVGKTFERARKEKKFYVRPTVMSKDTVGSFKDFIEGL